MRKLNNEKQAALFTSLAQHVESILADSEDYHYARQSIDLCWKWIEHRDVSGRALLDLYHADDDSGVDTAMYIEKVAIKKNVWACLGWALIFTSYCAYEIEGGPVPETIECVDPEQALTDFLRYFHGAVGDTQLPDSLIVFLKDLPDDHLTQAVVSAEMNKLA